MANVTRSCLLKRTLESSRNSHNDKMFGLNLNQVLESIWIVFLIWQLSGRRFVRLNRLSSTIAYRLISEPRANIFLNRFEMF